MHMAGTAAYPHNALRCLVLMAAHHGISASVERLVHDHALPPAEPGTPALLSLARSLGLDAKATKLGWRKLLRLGGAFPVLARLRDGNTVIVVGAHLNEQEVAVVDPLHEGVLRVPQESFTGQWDGDIVFCRRSWSLTDVNQPFGLRWFIPEILRQKVAFRDIAIAALALHLLGLVVPLFFQLVIDKVLVHHAEATLQVLTIGVAVAILFEAVFALLRRTILLLATNKIDIQLATRTFSHLLTLPINYFEVTSAGVTIQHMQQSEKIRQFLTGRLFLTLLDAAALVVFLPILFLYSTKLAVVTLSMSAAVAAVVLALLGPFRRRLKEAYEAEAKRQSLLVETGQGMRMVKAAAIEPVLRRRWDESAAAAVRANSHVGMISAWAQAAIGALERFMMVAVVALGAVEVFSGNLTVGALVAFQIVANRVSQPLVQLVSLVHEYQQATLAVRMLAQVMSRSPERPGAAAGLTPPIRGRVTFEGVSFRYAPTAAPALDRIDLDIAPGEVIGVVGRSGSGKTTLTRLLQGLYPLQEGVVRLDGVDIRNIDLVHLRRGIGVVLQDSFLLRGTVRENVAVTRPDAPFAEIAEAARLSGADEFIEHLPQGWDTPLDENAANLSGGQRQRLAIARALLPRPPILVLDEATSALDPDSEAIFLDNLAGIAAGRTLIIVSHRLSTLVGCNRILVFERGKLADAGHHADLLSRCEIYRHLWHRQNRHL